MKLELSAPAPEWLSLGSAILVGPADQSPNKSNEGEASSFRPMSGDSKSTRERVLIPGRNIEIKVDYPISWYRGSSLSPDGTKLIINSGTQSNFFEILPDNSYRAIDLLLPHVTYDAGPKGFITGWSWADNRTLIGEAEIDTESGEFIERRIYVYFTDEKILSRLDLSALNLESTEGLSVSKVAIESNLLRISVGGSELTVTADLKAPPRIEKQISSSLESSVPPSLPARVAPLGSKELSSTVEPESSTTWILLIVMLILVIGLLALFLKGRK